MYTSQNKPYLAGGKYYLFLTVFCILFAVIYEYFSFGVYSYPMMLSFVVPLVFGLIPMIYALHFRKTLPDKWGRLIYGAGVTTLAVGCIVYGVLEIYGTTNHLVGTYWYAGAVLIVCGLLRMTVARHERLSKSDSDGEMIEC